MSKKTKVELGAAEVIPDKDTVKIPPLHIKKIDLKVCGNSVIVHAWSEKAIKMMEGKQQGAARMKKAPINPVEEFEAAKYLVDGKDCLPSLGFKNAIVSAARFADDMKMTFLRGAIFIESEYLPLEFEECIMRTDMVRVGGMSKTATPRYRPEYRNWSVTLPIRYNANAITLDQLVNLVRLAGFAVGVFEWRPEKRGDFGRFDLAEAAAADTVAA